MTDTNFNFEIQNENDYRNAMKRIDRLMNLSDYFGEELLALAIAVEVYEKKHFPIPLPTVGQALQFRLEQLDLSEKALYDVLGGKKNTRLILTDQKKLTKRKMIIALHEKFDIPLPVLLRSE